MLSCILPVQLLLNSQNGPFRVLVCGIMRKPYFVPNFFFSFKDVMCQTVCTRHGLQEKAIRNRL